MNNELYHNLKNEMNNLNEFSKRIYSKKEEANESHSKAYGDMKCKERIVEFLDSQRKDMLSEYDWVKKLFENIMEIVLGVGVVVIMIALLGLLADKPFILQFPIIAFEFFGGILISGVIANKLAYKINEKILKKIEGSKEYIELSEKIDEAKKELELSRAKVDRKNKILKWQEGMYKQVAEERNKRKAFINYLENKCNPKEKTGNYSRKFRKQSS